MNSPRRPHPAGRLALPAGIAVALATALPWPAEAAVQGPEPRMAEATTAELADLPLEQLLDLEIVSASHFPATARQAPAAVHVITRSEIQARGWRTLGQALASLPGVYSSYDRSYLLLGARGLLHPGDYGSRFLLLVDGQRSNEPVYGQASVGTDAVIDIDLIERIEYVPGPGSAMFGSNAYLGVINVITLDAGAPGASGASVAVGSAGTRDLVASQSWSTQAGTGVLLALSSRRTTGRDLYFEDFADETHDGVARNLDHDRARRLLLKVSRPGVRVDLHYAIRTKGIPTASFEQSFNAPGAFVTDERTALNALMTRRLGAATELVGDVTLGHHRYSGDYMYGDAPFDTNRDVTSSSWIGTEWKLLSTAWTGHQLAVGTELTYDARLEQLNFDVDPYALWARDRRDAYRVALFVEDQIRLSDRLQLNAGIRLDHDSELGRRFSPRLALIANPSASTTLKAIAGEAFRAPNPYELHYGGEEVGQLPNPELQAESIRTTELVVDHQLRGGTSLSASLFRYRLAGLVSHVENDAGLLIFENFDSAVSEGIELGFQRRWIGGAMLRGSWSHAHARTSINDGTAWNSPRNMVKMAAILPLWQERVVLAAEAQSVGARQTRASRLPGYRRVDIATTWRPAGARVELRLAVENLFDVRYTDPTSVDHRQDFIAQDGRSVALRIGTRR